MSYTNYNTFNVVQLYIYFQIISFGAGFDTSYLTLNTARKIPNTKYIEVTHFSILSCIQNYF